ncbi:MAG: glycosyltransferase family A protein, partial [Chloroflexota bacterium]|nr:glycosyltransferase family A protein [Chloroflexota bacterium]
MPLISVIIPAHNAAIFLPDAIASLRAQRDLTFDILIIDDGSTDATPAVAATLGDDVRVIQTPKIGPGAARNRGIAAARGDYIALLDADDLFPPDSLTVRAERLALDATLMLTGGYIQMVTLLGADSTPAHDPTRIRNVPYLNVNLGAMLYRREVFERVGGFDERLFYSEDVDWHLRAQEANMRMAILRRVTLLYRRHAVNVTAQPTLAQIPLTTMGVLSRASERRGVPTTIDTLNRHFAACVDPLPDAPPPLISVIAYIGAANATHNDVSLDSVRGQVGMSDYLPLDLIVVGADADAVAARYEARAVAADSIDAAVGRNVGIAAA